MIQVIKLGAEWCQPCKAMAPTMAALAERYNVEGSDVQITSIDIDEDPSVIETYGVRSVPMIIFIVDGVIIEKKVGVMTAHHIEEHIKNMTL